MSALLLHLLGLAALLAAMPRAAPEAPSDAPTFAMMFDAGTPAAATLTATEAAPVAAGLPSQAAAAAAGPTAGAPKPDLTAAVIAPPASVPAPSAAVPMPAPDSVAAAIVPRSTSAKPNAKTANTRTPGPLQAKPGPGAPTPDLGAAPAARIASMPASGSGVAASPPADTSGAWRGVLAQWLQSHKVYPEAARRAGEEGRVAIRFTVDRTGQVRDVRLVSSSGSLMLDDAAQAMLRGARLPPLPSTMTQDEITVTVPIRYELTP